MNTLKNLLIVATCLFGMAYGEDFCFDEPCAMKLEAKAGYFTFADKKMSSIYNNGGYGLTLSGSYSLNDMFYLYGAVGYQQASGRSLHFRQKTTFWKAPP